MITMKPSGIAGCGMRPVSEKISKAMVRTTAKIAGGMFRSWAFAMDLWGGKTNAQHAQHYRSCFVFYTTRITIKQERKRTKQK
jgi:hypothetical protein